MHLCRIAFRNGGGVRFLQCGFQKRGRNIGIIAENLHHNQKYKTINSGKQASSCKCDLKYEAYHGSPVPQKRAPDVRGKGMLASW